MAFEIFHLIKRVELDVETHGAATFTLSTEQPDNALAVRFNSGLFDTGVQRIPVQFKMRGTTRARLYQATLYPTGPCRLFGARMLAKPLGQPGNSTWIWYPMPVRVTQEAYTAAALPIRPTAQDYNPAPLPIRPTSEEWNHGALPIAQTAAIPQWVSIPVDPIEFQTPPYRPLAGEG